MAGMGNVGGDASDWRNVGESAGDWAGGKERGQTDAERPCEAWRRGLLRGPLGGIEPLGARGPDGEDTSGGTRGIGWDGTRRGRSAQAPTWPLRRRKTDGSRRQRIGTGGLDANLGREWARPSDCRSMERGRWGHRGGGLGRPRGPGPRTRGLPNPGHRRRDWGGRRWGRAAQGRRRDSQKEREDRESDRECQKREWRQCAGQRQCDCDSERVRERCKKPGHRGEPTTCV